MTAVALGGAAVDRETVVAGAADVHGEFAGLLAVDMFSIQY
jgi:hypothetical protein